MLMNRDFLENLVYSYQKELFRYVRFLGAQHSDAEDIVQETYVIAFNSNGNGPAGEDSDEWARWLRGVARNMFLRKLQQDDRELAATQKKTLESADEFWEQEFTTGFDSEKHVAALKVCMKFLPERDRFALVLSYEKKKTNEEIAEVLSVSADEVRSLLTRIRGTLANSVSKQLGQEKEI